MELCSKIHSFTHSEYTCNLANYVPVLLGAGKYSDEEDIQGFCLMELEF